MVLLKGRLIVLLASMLVWSSIYCATLCAGEPTAGKTSSELPCHHHDPAKRPSCSEQQFPQFDVPPIFSTLTAHASIEALNGAAGSLMQVSPLCETSGALMPCTFRPPGLPLRPVLVLRI
jgi:hypothetical protein